jgi:hypothetical protein
MKTIQDSEGYKKLLAAVERDEKQSPSFHDYRAKLKFVVERAEHYAAKTGLEAADILDAWEKDRTYWYINYYQDSNQPEIKADKVRVFETVEGLMSTIGKPEFRCPMCGGISKSPYACDSGKEVGKGKTCDWKAYGLFGTLGKGISVFVKKEIRIETIFMPVSWEAITA